MTELKSWWMLAVTVTAGLPSTSEWWLHAAAAAITMTLVGLVFVEEVEKPPRFIVVLPTL